MKSHQKIKKSLANLEKINGKAAAEWVFQQNTRTRNFLTNNVVFNDSYKIIETLLNGENNIQWGVQHVNFIYNFWQDDLHPAGIWRRMTNENYKKNYADWEMMLDMDALNQSENADWVFTGADILYPGHSLALIYLSTGGDACEIREFDLTEKRFIPEGFYLPLAKSLANWIDENTLYVATDTGPASLSTSGYPCEVRRWERGTRLSDAPVVFQGEPDDIGVSMWYDPVPGYERDMFTRTINGSYSIYFVSDAGSPLQQLDIQKDAIPDMFNEWLLLRLATAWQVAGNTFTAGSLIACNLQQFLAGERTFNIIFKPQNGVVLSNYSVTKDFLILNVLDNVVPRVICVGHDGKRQFGYKNNEDDAYISVTAIGTNLLTNEFFLIKTGFLHPTTLYQGDAMTNELTLLQQEPAQFIASDFCVNQYFAKSADGTPIPYFQVSQRSQPTDSNNPVLLYGYGGFGISMEPAYLGSTGVTWLEKGGVFVIANIRGGGEYGPEWHQAALKSHRHRAYEDFAAVAQDLIRRGVTRPEKLAARGGSNGGLLIGNMLTDYPHLFGALVCEVPLLDMANYHRWLAGASWMDEFGNPDDESEWQFLSKYSPYEKIRQGKNYPSVLFTTATGDDRVSPAHARKMAAKMQWLGYENVWFYEHQEGGHEGGSQKQQIAFSEALINAYLWNRLSD